METTIKILHALALHAAQVQRTGGEGYERLLNTIYDELGENACRDLMMLFQDAQDPDFRCPK